VRRVRALALLSGEATKLAPSDFGVDDLAQPTAAQQQSHAATTLSLGDRCIAAGTSDERERIESAQNAT